MKHQLRDIEYFSAVAEHGNLGRAAEALGLSQPAISKSLRRLEKSMEAKLVKRTFKGVELTDVGATLFSHVRRLRFALDDVTREVADLTHGRTGHLRIGIAPTLAIHWLHTACATLLKEAPRVTFKITALDRETALSALRHGELDFTIHGLQPSRDQDLVEEYLCEEQFAVYAATSHRLAKKRQVTLVDLAKERWAVMASGAIPIRRLRQACLDAGLPPADIAVESNVFPLRLELVASSDLLGFTSKSEAAGRFGLVEIPARNWTYTLTAGVIYRKDAYLSPAARRFIEILKTTTRETVRDKS